MNARFVRAALLVFGAAAVGVVGTMLSQRIEAQAAPVSSGPLLVKMTPLPRDIVNVDVVTPVLTSGQSAVVYTVPANRSLVVTDLVLSCPFGTNSLFTIWPNYWDIIDGVTTQTKINGAAFDYETGIPSQFSRDSSHLSYHATNGIVFPAGSTVAFSLALGVPGQIVAKVHFDGYLSP